MRKRVRFAPRHSLHQRLLQGLGVLAITLLAMTVGALWATWESEPATTGAVTSSAAPRAVSTDQTVAQRILSSAREAGERVIPDWPDTNQFSVLLIGTDRRPNDVGRADVLLVVTVDPVRRAALLTTIPRDVLATLPGYTSHRINELLAIGGPELTLKGVQHLLGVPISYYVLVNFQGFRQVVDTLGGVDIEVKQDINDYWFPNEDDTGFEPFILKKGKYHMNGDMLLRYVRTRHDDPRGDFGRGERQQQVLMALKEQLLTPATLIKLPILVNQLQKMVETNFPVSRVLPLAKLGQSIPRERIYTKVIDYQDNLVQDATTDSGAYVLIPHVPNIQRMMADRLARLGQLAPIGSQEVSLRQADIEP